MTGLPQCARLGRRRGEWAAATLAVLLALAGPGAAASPPAAPADERLDALRQEASSARQAGDLERAEELLRQAVAGRPRQPEVYGELASVMAARGRGAEAVALLLDVGQRWLRAADSGRAAALLADAVEIAPDAAPAWALLGRSRVAERQFLAAETALRRALELGDRDPRTRLYLGSALWENGRVAEAETVYSSLVAATGRAPAAVQPLGRLLLWEGRYAEAVPLLEEVARQSPGSTDAQLDLARALEGAGRGQAALEAYQAVVELAPALSAARYGLGQALARAGRQEEARRQLVLFQQLYREEQERTRLEGLAQAAVDRGYDLVRQGRFAEAIAELTALAPTPASLLALSVAQEAAGDLAAAVAAVERAVAMVPAREDLRARLTDLRVAQVARP